MADTVYKVVTNDGATVNAGEQPKGHKTPLGLDEATANADAKARNKRAAELGIKTRYEVTEM